LEAQHGTFLVSHLLHAISAMFQLLQRLHTTNATSLQSLQHCCDLCNIATIACNKCDIAATTATLQRLHKKPICLQLSEFLKIHRKQEVGLKVCPKCFFTTLEQILLLYIFCLSHKEEMRRGADFFTAERVSSQQL
jgi:hypothetical protein